jgi:UDP-N-acetylglucosamine:LPS N-acetylglucosamine transferase
MVIIDPIPGQESRNSDYLLENGAAIKANNLASLGFKLTQFLTDPGRLTAARESASRLGKPRAAFDVAAHLLRLLPSRTPVQPVKRTGRQITRLGQVKRRLLRNV